MTGPVKLLVDGVTCRFGDTTALWEASLQVAPREFLSIVGPSGCGKSTLFNVISGLIRPSEGRVVLDDTDITGQTGHVGYMLQKDLLLPWRTVVGNISSWREAHFYTTERCGRASPASMSPLTPLPSCSRAVRRAWKSCCSSFQWPKPLPPRLERCPGRADVPTTVPGQAPRQGPDYQEAVGGRSWRTRSMWPWYSKGRPRLPPGVRRIRESACTWPRPI